jgi:hypothetical protein
MEKVKLFWGTRNLKGIGNTYGYAVHNNTLYDYVAKRPDLLQLVDTPEEADCGLYINTPEFLKNVPTKISFYFSMFEGTDMPDIYVENLKTGTFIITPSTWVKENFSKYLDPKKIFVVPHGVEPIFTYKERHWNPSKKFRFLWVGAPNYRKGWYEVAYIWEKVGFWKRPDMELYLKTTNINKQFETRGNVILDGRNLSKKDLVRLYHSAHCFLFPTRGEGFGLTAAEAMATGLPCISTNYSGITDFIDETVGFPVKYTLGEGEFSSPALGPLGKTKVAYADLKDITEKMIWILEHYKEAIKIGRRASLRIKRYFTWNLSAEKLCNVINEGMTLLRREN